jgi:hypothetical protein
MQVDFRVFYVVSRSGEIALKGVAPGCGALWKCFFEVDFPTCFAERAISLRWGRSPRWQGFSATDETL